MVCCELGVVLWPCRDAACTAVIGLTCDPAQGMAIKPVAECAAKPPPAGYCYKADGTCEEVALQSDCQAPGIFSLEPCPVPEFPRRVLPQAWVWWSVQTNVEPVYVTVSCKPGLAEQRGCLVSITPLDENPYARRFEPLLFGGCCNGGWSRIPAFLVGRIRVEPGPYMVVELSDPKQTFTYSPDWIASIQVERGGAAVKMGAIEP